jgi:hypothetical protein
MSLIDNFSDNELIEFSKDCRTKKEFALKLGYKNECVLNRSHNDRLFKLGIKFIGLTNYSDNFLINISKDCKSVSEVMRKVGFNGINGYAHYRFKLRLKKAGIYFDPILAKNWNKGMKFPEKVKDLNQYLVLNGPLISTSKLKHKLYKAGIKEPKCEICGIKNWLDKSLKFHLDHIDGNKKNCTIENLRVLCPNCHSQTETYGVIKKKLDDKGEIINE